MPDSQDYLEDLLGSISKAREDVDDTYRKDSEEAEKKAHKRASIGPDDDFVAKSGLSDSKPVRVKRKNLKKALSEDDFLSEFESMLDDPDDEDSLEESDNDDTDSGTDAKESLPDGDDVSPYFSKIGEPEKHEEESPKDDLMDDISSIVSNAKEKAGDSILNDDKKQSDTKTDEPILDDINIDDTDLSDTSAKDVDLMDESGDQSDLSDMLSSDGELSDIGDLLDADASGRELKESRDSFEESAEDASDDGLTELDDIDDNDLGDDSSDNRTGFLASLISKFKNIFSKKKDDDSLSTDDVIGDHADSVKELSDENEDIMSNFSDETEKPARKPAKPKKAKPAKEKKAKAPKPKKPKKEKPVDNSPVIPGKVVGVFMFLAVSIFALLLAGAVILPRNQRRDVALGDYSSHNYLDAYTYFATLNKPSKDDKRMLKSSRLAASITLKYNSYETAMERKAYDYALDALVRGYAEYEDNSETADKRDIRKYYREYGQRIIDQLRDQFGLTESDAADIASIKDRTEYTNRIDKVLEEKGLVSE